MEAFNSEQSQFFFSSSRNSELNLAMEEFFLNAVEPRQEILFFYENDPAVITGRFQNPWKECRTGLARRTGTVVRRRISGGGTVVHGPGNLNWSVISGRRSPDKEKNLDRVIAALKALDFSARRNERHDLLLKTGGGWRKIAGSAFRQTSRGSLHHATLLVNADLDFLGRLLQVPRRNIISRSVESTPSSVANLSQLDPLVTVGNVARAITGIWSPGGGSPHRLNPGDAAGRHGFDESRRRLSSDEWTWGRTPRFTERFDGLPGLGVLPLSVDVVGGCIVAVDSFTMEADDLATLIGCPYHGPDILHRLSASESASSGSAPAAWAGVFASMVDGDGAFK